VGENAPRGKSADERHEIITCERSAGAIFSPHHGDGTFKPPVKHEWRMKVFNSSVEKHVEKASAQIENARQHES